MHRYSNVEAPKGESGIFSSATQYGSFYRAKLRSPGFYNLQTRHYRIKQGQLADRVTVIGSQDIVFGEIDR